MSKTGTGALAFDAVINDRDLTESLKKSANDISSWADKSSKEAERLDASIKKVAKSVGDVGKAGGSQNKTLDFSGAERSLTSFNTKLTDNTQRLSKNLDKSGRDSLGFSNTFQNSVGKANSSYNRFVQSAQQGSAGIANSFKQIATAAIGFSAVGALATLPAKIIEVRGEFQNLEIAFETMLGSKAKADKLMSEVVTLAATTPFGLKDAAAATKQLLAYGSASNEVIGELKRLGDVAAGVGAPIQDLTYLYGTLRSQGKAMTIDIRQFAGRGIPIYKELSKVLKVNVEDVNKLVTDGKVGFAEVEQAFKNMTAEGGMFFNLMEKQSKSLSGLSSQLSDAIDIMFNDIGKSQEGFLATALTGATGLVKNYEQILNILKVSVAAYGAYKTATLIAAAATRVNMLVLREMVIQRQLAVASSIALTTTELRAAAATSLLQKAQASLNATMLANPYVLAATALAALIAYFVVYEGHLTEAEKVQKRLNDAGKENINKTNEETAKVQSLVSQIKSQNLTREDQAEKLRELISLNPKLLSGITAENIGTKESIALISQYIEAKSRQFEIDSNVAEQQESFKRTLEAKQGKDLGLVDKVGIASALFAVKGFYGAVTEYSKTYTDTKNAENKRIISAETEIQKKLEERNVELREAGKTDSIVSKQFEITRQAAIAGYDKEIAAEKKKQNAFGVTEKEYLASQEKIDEANRKRSALTEKLTSEEKKAAKESDKKGPYGSVAYWEYIKNAAEEVLSKTPTNKKDLIDTRKNAVKDADAKLVEAQKKVAIRSFEEEVQEKKRIYSQYQAWVEAYGEDAANKQFGSLKAAGDNYVAYLDGEINKLKTLAKTQKLSDSQTNNLSFLTSEKDQFTGKTTGIDVFKQKIDEAKDSSETLTDTLIKLRAIQDTLSTPLSTEDYEKRKLLAEEILNIEKERQRNLVAFLQGVEGSAAKELEITKHYADLRSTVEENYNKGIVKDRVAALAEIAKAEQDELGQQAIARAQGSEEFKRLNDFTASTGITEIKERLEKAKDYFNQLKIQGAQNTEEYRQQAQKIKAITKELGDAGENDFLQMADAVGALGQALSNLNGGGQLGSILGSLATGFAQVSKNLKAAKEADKSGASGITQYAQAAQGAVQLIGVIISSAKERKAVEEAYYKAVLSYESQYALAVNNRIRNQSIEDENIFVSDYQGRISDGIAAFKDANAKYVEAIIKIQEEGQVKIGTKKTRDWGKVAGSALTGAAAGAGFGGVGAIVGGAVGAAVGFFGGKKTVDVFAPIKEQFAGLFEVGEDGFTKLNKAMAESLIASGLLDEKTKVLIQSALDYGDAMDTAKQQILSTLKDLSGDLGNSLRNALVGAFEAGEDSAKAFAGVVGDVIENMISQLLFAKLFDPLFDQLQKDFQASADIVGGGDGNFVDDIIKFYQAAAPVVDQYNQGLETAKDLGKTYGLDLFSGAKPSNQATPALGTQISASQDSVSELTGQFNALRITGAATEVNTRDALFHLAAIKTNTDQLYLIRAELELHRTYLKNIDTPLSTRAGG